MRDEEPFMDPWSAADFTVAAMALLLVGGMALGLIAFILANGSTEDCRLPWSPPQAQHAPS